MGADCFQQFSMGKTAQIAFENAVEKAQYDHGHAGYTGTIAEKTDFIEIEVPKGREPEAFAGDLLDVEDPRCTDKWGPAGCVKIEPGKYLFFGWASS